MKALALVLGATLAFGEDDQLKNLGSKNYKERAVASKTLESRMTDELAGKLEKLMDDPSLEVARRAELLLRPYYEKKACEVVEKIKAECKAKLPCLDFLPYDQPDRFAQLTRVDYKAGGPPDWENYRAATAAYLLDLAREKVPIDTIRTLIEQMKKRELDWVRNCGRHYTPPIQPTWDPR